MSDDAPLSTADKERIAAALNAFGKPDHDADDTLPSRYEGMTLAQFLAEDYGEPCPTYHKHCPCCNLWRLYREEIASRPSQGRDREEG